MVIPDDPLLTEKRLKQTHHLKTPPNWKSMVGRWNFVLGWSIFRGELLVAGTVAVQTVVFRYASMDAINVQASIDNITSTLHFMKSWLVNNHPEILAYDLIPTVTG